MSLAKTVSSFLLVLCALLLASCGGTNSIKSGTAKAVTATDSLPPPDTTTASGAYVGASDYRVGALDLLEISVFQVPDLNRAVRINATGFVSLPLIGAVAAGGKTVSELEAEIAKRLSDQYLQNPQVSVFVKEFASQRVTIEGSVQNPGIFPITGPTTLLQMVATARGFTPLADDRAIIVFRTIKGQKMAALFNIRQIRSGDVEDPRIYGDDIIVVERSGARSAFKSVIDGLRGVIGFAPLL